LGPATLAVVARALADGFGAALLAAAGALVVGGASDVCGVSSQPNDNTATAIADKALLIPVALHMPASISPSTYRDLPSSTTAKEKGTGHFFSAKK